MYIYAYIHKNILFTPNHPPNHPPTHPHIYIYMHVRRYAYIHTYSLSTKQHNSAPLQGSKDTPNKHALERHSGTQKKKNLAPPAFLLAFSLYVCA